MTIGRARLSLAWQSAYRVYGVRTNVVAGPGLHLGLGTILWAPQQLTIGRDCYFGKGCTVEVDGHIGDYVLVANRVGLVGRRDHDHRQVGAPIRRAAWVGDEPQRLSDPLEIGDDVWIGYGAIILSGVSIGRGAVISAGSVVYRDVDPYTVVAGNPASKIGQRFTPEEQTRHEADLSKRSQTHSTRP